MTGFEMILPFLRPIEPYLLDPDVSEIMINGPERVFIERGGFLEEASGVTLNEKSLLVAVKNIARRLGSDISEEKPILRLTPAGRLACGPGNPALQSPRRHTHHPCLTSWRTSFRRRSGSS